MFYVSSPDRRRRGWWRPRSCCSTAPAGAKVRGTDEGQPAEDRGTAQVGGLGKVWFEDLLLGVCKIECTRDQSLLEVGGMGVGNQVHASMEVYSKRTLQSASQSMHHLL